MRARFDVILCVGVSYVSEEGQFTFGKISSQRAQLAIIANGGVERKLPILNKIQFTRESAQLLFGAPSHPASSECANIQMI